MACCPSDADFEQVSESYSTDVILLKSDHQLLSYFKVSKLTFGLVIVWLIAGGARCRNGFISIRDSVNSGTVAIILELAELSFISSYENIPQLDGIIASTSGVINYQTTVSM